MDKTGKKAAVILAGCGYLDGSEIHEDTLTWLNKCFLCMYMRMTKDDPTQITNWLDQYKIDYSHLVGNHIEKVLLLAPEVKIRETVKYTEQWLEEISKLLLNQKGKKEDLTDRMAAAGQALQCLRVELQSNIFVQED